MSRVDHVIVGARDLESAAAMMLDRYGLEALRGWDHVGAGTRNMVVPIGNDQYIELLAVPDPSSRHPVPTHLAPLVADGHRLLNVAIHPDDIDVTAKRLGEPVFSLDNTDEQGHRMRWRLTGLVGMLSADVLPFFAVTDEGRNWCMGSRPPEHRVEPDGFRWIEVGGDATSIRTRLADRSLPVRVAEGRPGVLAIGIGIADGSELEIRF